MISLFHACCSTILSRTGSLVTKSPCCGHFYPSWATSFNCLVVGTVNLNLMLSRFQVQCYSSKKSAGDSCSKPKIDCKPQTKHEKEEFFLVRKGDLIGVYNSLSDCQAQVGTSICDPPVSVYRGCSMPKDTEKYLISCGLKNALYSIRASDLTEDLFGTLVACPFQLSSSRGETSREPIAKKRSQKALSSDYESSSSSGENSSKPRAKKKPQEVLRLDYGRSCILEFDGASKGNPGQAGAGAILRSEDGSLIYRLREGLGIATNNVAEYRSIILGLRYALGKGFTSIQVQGDSKLVCMQMGGEWKVKNQNISMLYEEAKNLKDRFLSFQIVHVLRGSNSEADAQANLAIDLAEGQIQEVIDT